MRSLKGRVSARTSWFVFDTDRRAFSDISLGWYGLRTPLRPYYSTTSRPGYLALRGSAIRLEIDESPSLLLSEY